MPAFVKLFSLLYYLTLSAFVRATFDFGYRIWLLPTAGVYAKEVNNRAFGSNDWLCCCHRPECRVHRGQQEKLHRVRTEKRGRLARQPATK